MKTTGYISAGARILPVLLITLLISLVYYPARDNPFVYDDHETITKNPHIKRLASIPSCFNPVNSECWSVHPGQQMFYRPLPLVSFAINYRLSGLSPGGYRLTNVGLHIAATLLLYVLILATHRVLATAPETGNRYRNAALLAALLFALHPIQTESVAYIVSRSVIICTIFILTSLLCHLKSLVMSGRMQWAWRLAGLSGFLFALLSKEVAVVFPLLLMALVWSFAVTNRRERPVRFTGWQGLPYLVLLALYLIMRIFFIGQAPMTTLGRQGLFYFFTASKALFIYLRLIFLPVGQNVDHHLPIGNTFADPVGLLAAIAVICLLLLVMKRLVKTPGFRAFWLSWFFLSILPNLVLPTNEAISEHSAYLPSMGVLTVSVFALARVLAKSASPERLPRILMPGLALVCLVQVSFLTVHRNRVWSSPVTLWNDTLSKNPDSDRAMNNLGLAWLHRGQFTEARQFFSRAINLNPTAVAPINNLGIAYGMEGVADQSKRMFQKALALEPAHVDSLNNLGIWHLRNRTYHQAAAVLTKARHLAPHSPDVAGNLGLATIHIGKIETGCRLIEASLHLNPDSTRSRTLADDFCR